MRSSVARSTPGLDVRQHAEGLGRAGRLRVRRRVRTRLVEGDLQLVVEVDERLLGLLQRDVAALDERLDVQLADAAPFGDRPVHQRLCVARVVAFVVTVTAVAHHVDHDVLVERLAVLPRQLGDLHAGLGVVAVDVEDRRLDGLGHVGAVQRRAGVQRRGREADLVVDDQVDGATDAVPADVAHRQSLGDDALAGEGGIAVDEHRQHGESTGRLDLVLLGADHAEHDRPDGLEVARVGGQLHRDRGARRTDVLALHPEVVLHVARPLHRVGVDVALELGEDRLVALAHDVRQHVQPATVGHAERDAVERGIGRVGEDLVEDRDRRLGTLDAEPLRADVLRGEELLERLGRVQPLEDPVLLFLGRRLLPGLDLVLDPELLVGVLDVHVLHTDGAAVGIAQHAEQVAEAHLVDATDPVGEELPVEVPDREAVRRGVELARRVRFLPTQRVEVGDQVAADAVHTDELGDRHLLAEHRLFVVDRVRVRPPLDRLVGHAERMEDVVVEAVLAEQQFVHPLQEESPIRRPG